MGNLETKGDSFSAIAVRLDDHLKACDRRGEAINQQLADVNKKVMWLIGILLSVAAGGTAMFFTLLIKVTKIG